MKLENLNRAKDLKQMRDSALRLLEKNTEALSFMKSYTWDCGYYPFHNDPTYQTSGSAEKNSKFLERITVKGQTHMMGEIFCTIPLDLLIKATQEEINRLSARIEEIDKEVEGL